MENNNDSVLLTLVNNTELSILERLRELRQQKAVYEMDRIHVYRPNIPVYHPKLKKWEKVLVCLNILKEADISKLSSILCQIDDSISASDAHKIIYGYARKLIEKGYAVYALKGSGRRSSIYKLIEHGK